MQRDALSILVTFSFYADADTSSDEEDVDWEAISAGADENVKPLGNADAPPAKRMRSENIETRHEGLDAGRNSEKPGDLKL